MINEFDQVDWLNEMVLYEVNLRQYTAEGTINAFAKELPRLKAMGVQSLWFMPITAISLKERKGTLGSQYAAADYCAVADEFGTLEDFRELVITAQAMGFKIILDWVANHTGWDHVWTKEHPAYYLIDEKTKGFKRASGMEDIIELDYNNPDMRRAMIKSMHFWIKEVGIDGFRCDLAAWVQLDFWQQARATLQPFKKMFWLGEFDPIEHKDYMTVFDVAYTWKWMHKTEEFYRDKLELAVLDGLLHEYGALHSQGALGLWFTSNHDENSWNGTEYEKYGPMADALAVLSFTYPGIPLIYSGQELPNLKRLKFFEKDVIDWDGTYKKADFFKTLIDLKKSNPALNPLGSEVTRIHPEGAQTKVLSFVREQDGNIVLVLINFSKEVVSFTLDYNAIKGIFYDAFDQEAKIELNKETVYDLEPWGYRSLYK